jgi:hypothetical protein
MAISAPTENQAMLRRSCGRTINTASSGPRHGPPLLPGANSACAKP